MAEEANDTDAMPHIIIHPASSQREGVATDIGASEYQIGGQGIAALPEGQFTPFNEVLLQAPGAAQDSYGQVHIRGDHADLQYRINGIILPEGISGFGQTLDTHFAGKVQLLTGALPAQYGYRTAGIVDITTPNHFDNGGESSVMLGSNSTIDLSQEFYGSKEHAEYFFTGDYTQNNHGLEPPTAGYTALHDATAQDRQFGYLSYAMSPETRFSIMVGNSTNRFKIPDNPGQPPNFLLANVPSYSSGSVDERQYEHNSFGIAAINGNYNEDAQYQFAYFTRDSTVLFKPDVAGDLIFNGIASRDERESFTNGIQGDNSYRLNNTHTLRGGWFASYEQASANSNSLVFPADPASGMQLSSTPYTIMGSDYQVARLAGLYLQDEWRLTDKLTLNYGARYDVYSAYINDSQLSPRIGLVYDATQQTRLHAGYARYFTPPPTELIAPVTLQNFAGTTAMAPTSQSSPVVPEKDNYFDAGVIQKIGDYLTLGLDGYYKQAHDLLDEGQFGQALIFAPFNYEKGWVKGIEFTGDYHAEGLSAYANLAVSQALGKNVVSGEYNFDPDEYTYIQSNAVHLDHDQLISGSAGVSYLYRTIQYSTDVTYGTGLRSGFANSDHLPFYAQVNLGIEHNFDLGPQAGSLDAKFSIINLFDRIYELRDGSGIGVFAPQYAPRRGFFVTLSKPFSW